MGEWREKGEERDEGLSSRQQKEILIHTASWSWGYADKAVLSSKKILSCGKNKPMFSPADTFNDSEINTMACDVVRFESIRSVLYISGYVGGNLILITNAIVKGF